MKIIYKRVRLDCMQIFPPGRQTSITLSGCGGGAGEGEYSLRFWAGVSSVTQEPLAFTTQCSAAVLPPLPFWAYVFVICVQQKPTKKAYTV